MEPSTTAQPPSPPEHAVPGKTFGKGTTIGRVKAGVALRIVSSLAITPKRDRIKLSAKMLEHESSSRGFEHREVVLTNTQSRTTHRICITNRNSKSYRRHEGKTSRKKPHHIFRVLKSNEDRMRNRLRNLFHGKEKGLALYQEVEMEIDFLCFVRWRK